MQFRKFLGICTLCCAATTPTWADRSDILLDGCLEYQSCVLSLLCGGSIGNGTINTGNVENDALLICNQANPTFVSMVSTEILTILVNNAIQTNAIYPTCAIYGGGYDSTSKTIIQEWIYPACRYYAVVSSLPTNNEYYDISFSTDSGNNIHLAFPIRTCPDGGMIKHFTINQYIDNIGIENCYTTTFSDSTGNGVFTSDCYYTK